MIDFRALISEPRASRASSSSSLSDEGSEKEGKCYTNARPTTNPPRQAGLFAAVLTRDAAQAATAHGHEERKREGAVTSRAIVSVRHATCAVRGVRVRLTRRAERSLRDVLTEVTRDAAFGRAG